MKIITTIHEMQSKIRELKKQRKSVGFVPTMGFLHDGHLSLLKKAREENEIVVLSIFVNPLQFGPSEDLSSYPRNFEQDSQFAKEHNTDIIFYPSVEEMYPNQLSVTVKVHARTDVLCGKSRPGHFDGVATVLTKFFNIVQPERVYFGMKDAQQVAVVTGLVQDFNFPLEIIPVETVREADGLAKSSRNVNLLPAERDQAPILFESLSYAKRKILEGEKDPKTIISAIKELIETKTNGLIDYIEIYSYPNLEEISRIEGSIIIALAVKFSKARLIDNMIINIK